MKRPLPFQSTGCCGSSRRIFLADAGMGFTGLVLSALLDRDGSASTPSAVPWSPPDGQPHFTPKAKRVIWIFMLGGVSHLESFDPKPALNRYAGMSIAETPHGGVLTAGYTKDNLRPFLTGDLRHIRTKVYPLQIGFRKRGQSGIEVSDWWPHVGQCIDDLSVIRSMWTTDNNHGAILQFHTGRHIFDGYLPTIGSWVHYGLGSLNENLPRFMVLGEPPGDCCGGIGTHGAGYLGPANAGVPIEVDPENPLPFASPGPDVYRVEQKREFELLQRLHRLSEVKYPDDPKLQARIKSYELAFRMQTAVPEALQFRQEGEETRRLYGLEEEATRPFGEVCLAARRLSERGVRFVQVYHGTSGNRWDAHRALKKSYNGLCRKVDKPIAGLLRDLKQRGLLDETLVVWATEFGRTLPKGLTPVLFYTNLQALKEPADETTTPTPSPSGWRAAVSREDTCTAPPTSWVFTPPRTATTSPTPTPPCCICWASIPAGWQFPDASGWKWILATPSPTSSPDSQSKGRG